MALVASARCHAEALGWGPAQANIMPLFYTTTGSVPTKAKVVETFEALATATGLPLLSPEGLRLFGGHTARVTGAQALAACGVSIDKIRILARHSGDAVLRYVAQAPLKTLRKDLGLPEPGASSSSTSLDPSRITALQQQLVHAMARVDAQEVMVTSLRTLVQSAHVVVYVQNLATRAVHGLRAGDAQHTICGWNVGATRQRRGGIRWLQSIGDTPWWLMCDRCLLAERNAAKLLAHPGEQPLSD